MCWPACNSYCDFHNYEYTEVQIPTCKTAFSLPSINDNQSVPLIFLTDGSENANSNGQLQRRCPRNNENRSKAKVIQLGEPNEIWANKSKLTMVEGTVANPTGNIRLIIQEHLISKIQQGCTYIFKKIKKNKEIYVDTA